jgi:hypothetical protein
MPEPNAGQLAEKAKSFAAQNKTVVIVAIVAIVGLFLYLKYRSALQGSGTAAIPVPVPVSGGSSSDTGTSAADQAAADEAAKEADYNRAKDWAQFQLSLQQQSNANNVQYQTDLDLEQQRVAAANTASQFASQQQQYDFLFSPVSGQTYQTQQAPPSRTQSPINAYDAFTTSSKVQPFTSQYLLT